MHTVSLTRWSYQIHPSTFILWGEWEIILLLISNDCQHERSKQHHLRGLKTTLKSAEKNNKGSKLQSEL